MSEPINEPLPAPGLASWILDHLKIYLATNGEQGHLWSPMAAPDAKPVTALLLTTTGRKSGQRYIMPLFYGDAGGRYVIIASKGGAPDHPGWYKNLSAHPDVDVQIKARKFKARARTVTGPERQQLWDMMAAAFPSYNDYQKKAGREIPVVVLDPV
jgi:deazaflavin-dependent oxidoreductase (nitroreductase family)